MGRLGPRRRGAKGALAYKLNWPTKICGICGDPIPFNNVRDHIRKSHPEKWFGNAGSTAPDTRDNRSKGNWLARKVI